MELYYKYLKMDMEQFAILEDNIPSRLDHMEFETSVQFNFDKDQDVISNRLTLTIMNSGALLLKAVMCSYFLISKKSIEAIEDEKGQLTFNPMSLVQFASLNYGSLRGALYFKCQGTRMSECVLPPVFFGQIIDKPFVVD
ncbi:MAG: hypothetical protein ACRCZM_11555 [Bacteroidales bacterium]